MNSVTEDTLQLLPEYCSDHQTQMTQGKIRPSRRKKKVKGEAKVGLKKRRLSDEQVKLLEISFDSERKLESARKDRLARELDLDSRQVAVWFQNRRVRWKSKRLEEELLRLKAVNESVVVEKCKLEEEILKLRMRLSEAESELRKLSGNSNGVWEGERSSNSPSSSLSMNGHKPLLGDLGDIFYAPESNYCYINGIDEWMNLYGSMIN